MFKKIAGILSLLTSVTFAQVALSPPQLGDQGKFRLSLPAQPGHYGILSHSRDLKTWKPVDLIALDEFENWLVDPILSLQKGFYQAEIIPNSTPRDSDDDGIDDLTELMLNEHSCAAFNAAMTIPPQDGAIFIPTLARFDQLAKRDDFPGATNVKEVKFLITDIRTQPKLYFFNVSRHQFHVNFATNVLRLYPGVPSHQINSVFTNETYFTNGNRKNLAGSLVAHDRYVAQNGRTGIYTVEFWPTDPVPFEFIELAYEMIARCTPFIENLAYHAPSETQRTIQKQAKDQFENSFIHTIETEELFGQVEYQPMHQREAFGQLKIADGTSTLSARDIVIFKNLPNDLTKVSGIITEVPQTPLSHVNLKAQQNDTPNAFIAHASTHPDIEPFLGQNVYYKVSPEGFEIRTATQEEVDTFFEQSRPTTTSFPPRNLSLTEIRPLANITFADANSYGAKATNVAELLRLFPQNAPDGFAIPFYFYDEFMKHNGFYDEARTMINDPNFQTDPSFREAQLQRFRKRIKKESSFPFWMIEALTDLQNSFPENIEPRLRSSANAEDSTTFNGAGLYDSFTQKDDEGFIGKSVRQVWASLWNYRAYEEREFYRIDHLTSAMGILVHPSEKDEQANGVAVARNIFDPNWEGYYFNAQIGEDLVTNPEANSIPEELLVADLNPNGTTDYEIQYIRFSNKVAEGETVLNQSQVLDLTNKMRTLNSHFRRLYQENFNFDFAMEIEFKITKDGILSIKQARPYVN